MDGKEYEVGEYEVFYSQDRAGYVVGKKVGAGLTIVNVFWRGDDGGFTSAKTEADHSLR